MQQLRKIRQGRVPSLENRVQNGLSMWQTEMRDLDSSGKAVCGRVIALSGALTQLFNDVLAEFDLKYPEYGVLATLRASGAPYSMSQKQLLETILFSSGGMSNLLTRLERRGFIERFSDDGDRRITHVRLTDRGIETAGKAMPIQSEAENTLYETLSAEEKKALIGALSKLLDTASYL